MDDKVMNSSFLLAECLRQCGEAMKDNIGTVSIEFTQRPVIRASNKASMEKSAQKDVYEKLNILFPNWTIILDSEQQKIDINFESS